METLLQQNYWHVYSDGIQADIPFCSDEDKIFALNSVAIVAFCTGMTVLCVVVNDTHLHAVLYGTRGLECRDELYFAEPKENGKALGELYVRREDEQTMKQQLHGRYLEERRIQDMRERGNRLSNSYFGKSLIKLDITCRLHVASKMIKEGTGFKSDSFAKALYLKPQDLDNLL